MDQLDGPQQLDGGARREVSDGRRRLSAECCHSCSAGWGILCNLRTGRAGDGLFFSSVMHSAWLFPGGGPGRAKGGNLFLGVGREKGGGLKTSC